MKKRALSLFLAFVMTLSLAAPAFGADEAFLAEDSAAVQEDMAPAPAAPEDPVPMEAEPAPPVEAEPAPAEDYVPAAVDEPAPASLMADTAANEPAPAALGADAPYEDSAQDFNTFWIENLDGQKITMNADATVSSVLATTNARLIVDGDHSIANKSESKDISVISVNNENASLTLDGSVSVYSVEGSTQPTIDVSNGELTIKGSATVEHKDGYTAVKVQSSGNVTVSGNGTVTGTLTITGGKLTVEEGAEGTIGTLDVTNLGSGEVKLSGGKYGSITGEDLGALLAEDYYFATQADSTYVDPAEGPLNSVQVLPKKTIELTTPPKGITGMTYTAGDRALVEKSVITGGTVKYAVSEDGETPPEEKEYLYTDDRLPWASLPGTYYVWWKVVPDPDYKEYAGAEDDNPIKVTIGKAPTTTVIGDLSGLTYGAGANTVTVTVTAPNVTQYDGGSITLKVGETSIASKDSSSSGFSNDGTHQMSKTFDLTAENLKALAKGATLEAAFTDTAGADGEGYLQGSKDTKESVTVQPKEITPSADTIELTLSEKIYDGQKNLDIADIALDSSVKVGSDVVDIDKDAARAELADLVDASDVSQKVEVKLTGLKLDGTDAKLYKLNPDNCSLNNIDLTIKKGESSITGERVRAATGLVFSGTSQSLVTEGAEATGGMINYAVADGDVEGTEPPEGVSFGTATPQKTDAGTYTVWYKVVGDRNHNNSATQKFTVEIAKAETKVTLAITKGVTEGNKATYGGGNVELTATVTGADGNNITAYSGKNGKVTLKLGGQAFSGVNSQDVTFTSGEGAAAFTLTSTELRAIALSKNKALTAEFTPDEGDNKLLGSTSNEVTIDVQPKVITAADLKFELKDGKVYDGTNVLAADKYTLTLRVSTNNLEKLTINHGDAELKDDTLDGKEVGTYNKVTVKDLVLAGDTGLYTLSGVTSFELDSSNSVSVEVTKAPISFTENEEGWQKPYNKGSQIEVAKSDIIALQNPKTPALTEGDIKVSYKYGSQPLDTAPTMPGVYEVYADVTNTNFQLTTESPAHVGTLTITHVHEWNMSEWDHYDPDTKTGYHWHPCNGEGECGLKTAEDFEACKEQKDSSGNTNGYTAHNWLNGTDEHHGWVPDPDDECAHRTCADCGYVATSTHEWDGEWCYNDNEHYKVCSICGLEYDHEAHDPVLSGVTGEDFVEYKCTTCGWTFKEPIGVYPVKGTVTQKTEGEPAPVHLAKVELAPFAGGEAVAATETGVDGKYEFLEVKPGVYTLKVTFQGVTVTSVVEVADEEVTADVIMPLTNVKVELTYDVENSDTPKVTVSGLDQVAAAKAESGETVTMTINAEEEASVSGDVVAALKEKAGGQSGNLSYLDVTIKVTGSGEPEELHETDSIITLVVSYDFSGKNNITVYRYHEDDAGNSETIALTPSSSGSADGTYRLDTARGLIYIYASKFSVYAIGYTEPYYPSIPTTDKTALNAAITAAEELKEEDYTPESWSALETALAAAKGTADNLWATQTMVDSAQKALKDAVNALVPVKADAPADKRELEGSIGVAEELTEEDYTPETWAVVEDALAKAKDVYADEDATQEDVDAALKALDAAIDALEEVPPVDKSLLEELITAAEAINEAECTPESWAAMVSVLERAKEIYADPDATQEEVDAIILILYGAILSLEPAEPAPEVDKSQLEQTIADAEALNEEEWTPETWADMMDALEAAKAVYADPDATQEEVDDADLALFVAILYLEDVNAEPLPPAPPASGTGWSYDEATGVWYFYKNNWLVSDYWVGKVDGASQWDGNWYYVGVDGKMLTGMQYLDDLHGGMGWYFLQPTNKNGEIGKMLTGWQWVGGEYGTGWFSTKEGSAGKCTYTTELGDWNGSAWMK